MQVKIQDIQRYKNSINAYELTAIDGSNLPYFEPGSHIDVKINPDLIRQYSIANSNHDLSKYVVGVLKCQDSRGGSEYIHDHFNVGDIIEISEPKNFFKIDPDTQKALLIAGGIGITPILSMAHFLKLQQIPFELHYFCKSSDHISFTDVIDEHFTEVIHYHFDNESSDRERLFSSLKAPAHDHHLYICGPQGFMDYVFNLAMQHGWEKSNFHQELFALDIDQSDNKNFTVTINSSKEILIIPEDKSVLEVLEDAGYAIPKSCEQGICGTCLLNVLEGQPDHKDMFLSDEEQALNNSFLPCCSRSITPNLTLDL